MAPSLTITTAAPGESARVHWANNLSTFAGVSARQAKVATRRKIGRPTARPRPVFERKGVIRATDCRRSPPLQSSANADRVFPVALPPSLLTLPPLSTALARNHREHGYFLFLDSA